MPGPYFDPIQEAYRKWTEYGLEEPLAMSAATSIMRAQQLVSIAVDRALRPYELTFARYEVLMLLSFARSGSLPISKMGERLMVHPTGITKLIDKLEAQGLVIREPNPHDGRGILARIKPQGRRRALAATRAVGEMRFGMNIEDPELKQIIDSLTRYRLRSGDIRS